MNYPKFVYGGVWLIMSSILSIANGQEDHTYNSSDILINSSKVFNKCDSIIKTHRPKLLEAINQFNIGMQSDNSKTIEDIEKKIDLILLGSPGIADCFSFISFHDSVLFFSALLEEYSAGNTRINEAKENIKNLEEKKAHYRNAIKAFNNCLKTIEKFKQKGLNPNLLSEWEEKVNKNIELCELRSTNYEIRVGPSLGLKCSGHQLYHNGHSVSSIPKNPWSANLGIRTDIIHPKRIIGLSNIIRLNLDNNVSVGQLLIENIDILNQNSIQNIEVQNLYLSFTSFELNPSIRFAFDLPNQISHYRSIKLILNCGGSFILRLRQISEMVSNYKLNFISNQSSIGYTNHDLVQIPGINKTNYAINVSLGIESFLDKDQDFLLQLNILYNQEIRNSIETNSVFSAKNPVNLSPVYYYPNLDVRMRYIGLELSFLFRLDRE